MDQQSASLSSGLARATTALWTALMNAVRIGLSGPTKNYRPEAYYMRGPGPKWREKHAGGRQ
jgi:hypothetical protein